MGLLIHGTATWSTSAAAMQIATVMMPPLGLSGKTPRVTIISPIKPAILAIETMVLPPCDGAAAAAVQVGQQQQQRKRERPDRRGNPRPGLETAPSALGEPPRKMDRNDRGRHQQG